MGLAVDPFRRGDSKVKRGDRLLFAISVIDAITCKSYVVEVNDGSFDSPSLINICPFTRIRPLHDRRHQEDAVATVEGKHLVLGLVVIKRVSRTFAACRAELH